MIDTAPLSVIDRFAGFFQALLESISPKPMLSAPTLMAVVRRLDRLWRRFGVLASHASSVRSASAGEPAETSRAAVSGDAAQPGRAHSRRMKAVAILPRQFSWLAGMLSDAAGVREHLTRLLADPEVAALVAAEPRLRRVLAPLAHMIGVRPRPALAALQPRPPRPRQPSPGRTAAGLPWPKRCAAMAADDPEVPAALRCKPGWGAG